MHPISSAPEYALDKYVSCHLSLCFECVCSKNPLFDFFLSIKAKQTAQLVPYP